MDNRVLSFFLLIRYAIMGHGPLTLLSYPALMLVWNSTFKAIVSTGMLHCVVS